MRLDFAAPKCSKCGHACSFSYRTDNSVSMIQENKELSTMMLCENCRMEKAKTEPATMSSSTLLLVDDENTMDSSTAPADDCGSQCPWVAPRTIRGTPAKHMLWSKDDELIEAAMMGDCARLEACVERGALLSVVRTLMGATALHYAVLSGNLSAAELLVKAGAYVDVTDWKGDTPLYYALTKSGKEDVLEREPEKRAAMIEFLINHGADTMCLTRPGAEKNLSPNDNADLLSSSQYHKKFVEVQEQLQGTSDDISVLSGVGSTSTSGSNHALVDIMWCARTAQWLICYNRATTMRRFEPKPSLRDTSSLQNVEKIFLNCQDRLVLWMKTCKDEPQEQPRETTVTLSPKSSSSSSSERQSPKRKKGSRRSTPFFKPKPHLIPVDRPAMPQNPTLKSLVSSSQGLHKKTNARAILQEGEK